MAVLSKNELKRMDEYFRVLNYLSVAQLYLLDNPLLNRKLSLKDVKPNVVGHWGTVPGQNFIYVHLNRIINKYDLNILFLLYQRTYIYSILIIAYFCNILLF